MSRALQPRGRYEGLLNVVRFNWPMIALGFGGSLLSCALARILCGPRWLKALLGLGGAAGFTQTTMSLAVTHAVYDRSGLYRWEWLRPLLTAAPRRIANVHSGFDESTAALKTLFPDAEVRVFDFYDPRHQTEPSITRARALYPPAPETEHIRIDHLPVETGSQDLVTFFLAAHEVREATGRATLLREAARCLAPDGRLVIVEHLRDLPNFAAYGPGAFHFHSRSQWLEAIRAGGLQVAQEVPITPFIRIFSCCQSS